MSLRDPMHEPSGLARFDSREDDAEDNASAAPWPFEITQADLIGLTIVVAILVMLTLWLGARPVLVILGGAGGGFAAALVGPYVGFDHVLDDLRLDVVRCLALSAYFILGFWGMLAVLRAMVEGVHEAGAPVFVSRGLVIVFLGTVVLVAKGLWMDNGKAELIVVTLGTAFGAIVTGALIA
ncbi:MAG: hypothetical protein U1E05_09870 [Patescibacteria group bacterium]|nr:hypothetical protein [Patescibacteria group bacterium]